jgi:hypothetical protein
MERLKTDSWKKQQSWFRVGVVEVVEVVVVVEEEFLVSHLLLLATLCEQAQPEGRVCAHHPHHCKRHCRVIQH